MLQAIFRYFILSVLLVISCISCGRTSGFCVKKITPKQKRSIGINEGNVSLARMLSSDTFAYIGSGSHTYVFANDRYVIKFFKQKRLESKKKKKEAYTSVRLAHQKLLDSTGVVYYHFAKSNDFTTLTRFTDQKGSPFSLNLNEQEFIIQRRAEIGFAALEKMIDNGESRDVIEALTNLIVLIQERSEKDLFDRDLQIFKNFGFIGKQPIEVDIGNLRIDPNAHARLERQLASVRSQIMSWIEAYCPELKEEFDA